VSGGAFAGERAVVIGLGLAGAAAARVLAEEGASVRVSEARPEAAADPALAALGVEVLGGEHRPEHLDGATLVVTSPGVPEGAPVLAWARDRDLPVWSELEIGARMAPMPYVAVTGTNGKTTTTEMVAAAMREAGLAARACGNVGYPFSVAVREPFDALAVEVSSFQLRFLESFHPRVSVLLNLSPDHLDWHGSVERYVAAKRRILVNQGPGDAHVGNRDDALAGEISRGAAASGVDLRWFTLGPPGPGEVGYEGAALVSRAGVKVPLGVPASPTASHRADAAAAAAAAIAFGLDAEAAGRAVCAFRPLPHRGEVVASVGRVRFVDDSKATNPHAALAAVEGATGVVLIAGGMAKGVDLSPLARAVPALAGVVAIGQAADELVALFDGLVPVRRAAGMDEAVRAALEMAPPDGTVILAPACASQDMFRDYAERGARFAEAAARLSDPDGAREGASRAR